MSTVTIYRITCTDAQAMYETGTRYSVEPWGCDTDVYKGYDDGGHEYELPKGFTVGTTQMGIRCIFDEKDRHVELCGKNAPTLIGNDTGRYISLKKVEL